MLFRSLPNFGRVWQSGTRKDSKKEFEKENSKKREVHDMENSEQVLQVKPYISKRLVCAVSLISFIFYIAPCKN